MAVARALVTWAEIEAEIGAAGLPPDITSTDILQLPVDCVIAGQQDNYKKTKRYKKGTAQVIRYKTIMGKPKY